MIPELTSLLRKISSGDNTALQTILKAFTDQTISSNEQEQIHLYLKQAVRQSPHAIYFLALLYKHGFGVKQNLDMVFVLMREAAAKGHTLAIYEVGHCFLLGSGEETNYENARQWLGLAAGSPHYVAEAMYDLGVMYEEGLGVEKDLKQAKDWYEKAAKKGHERARGKLEIL